MIDLARIPPDRPVLIAGPTASGKSGLALDLAQAQGGVIVNADALQVFANWHLLTARPSAADESRARHGLYGHVPHDAAYSVGHWLRDLAPYLDSHLANGHLANGHLANGHLANGPRPIIVGGTGLYFTALTEGLADIPATPPAIRARADALPLDTLLSDLDAPTRARIDTANRARVQRAWEVLHATGRGLAAWQDETPPPRLPLANCTALVIDAPKQWLTPRIAARFDQMLAQGALDEAAANLPHWDPALPSMKAIGAPELIAHLRGEISLDQAREAAIIATRQYAKRQRTWFAKRMRTWQTVSVA